MAKMNGTRVSNLLNGQQVEIAGNPVTIKRSSQINKRTYKVTYIDVYGDTCSAEFDCNHKFENLDSDEYMAFLKEIDEITSVILK